LEIQMLRERIRRLATVDSTVLITGETGTGKGLVARLLHDWSEHRRAPFVHVDCAALSPSIMESELFGHERGAFTGASEQRIGRFEQAQRGTVFLDEIGELPPPIQAKLLRVLQDREFERVGGCQILRMEARIVAATNRQLEVEIAEGRFRSDLFFRLNVLPLRMPALRERREDIPFLVQDWLERVGSGLGEPPGVSEAFLKHLTEQPWPGNVRELMNLLERLIVLRPCTFLDARFIDPLPQAQQPRTPDCGQNDTLDRSLDHSQLLASILVQTGGNVSRAARRLRMPRSTLRYQIDKHGLRHLIPAD
jgi:DNA-binding NtrC family response regulator